MKNILMIMFGRSVGGAELQFLELANHLSNTSKVKLVSLGGGGALENVYVDESIDVKVYEYTGKLAMLQQLSTAFLKCNKIKPSTIISTAFVGNSLGLLLSNFCGAKLISMQTIAKSSHYPPLEKYILKKFDLLIAGAHDIRNYLVDYEQVESKIITVHNWVDFTSRVPTEDKNTTAVKYGLEGKIVIGCISRMHEQKGHMYLLKAFEIIMQHNANIVLFLAGDGPLKNDMEALAEELGISANTKFVGVLSGDDYNNAVNFLDVFVQPSLYEGLPRTLLDAMFLKKAIVATNINGHLEALADPVAGLLVPPRDPDSLAHAILALVHDTNQGNTLASAARSTAEVRFSMDKQLNKIYSLIE